MTRFRATDLPPRRPRSSVGAIAAAALAVIGCSSERERPSRGECTSWTPDVQPVVTEQCAGCHGGDEPAGSYELTSYLGALGSGTDDTPNAVAGDADSAILTALTAADASEPHATLADEVAPLLRDWVVACELSHSRSLVHAGGIMNPADDDFHARLLERERYDFALCADCHGEDFGGGTADAACTSCHEEGPTDCTTCHGDLVDRLPHAAHLGPTFAAAECASCHPVPSDYRDEGHLLTAAGEVDERPAELAFGELAGATPRPDAREGPPSYDFDTQTCSNVYCHGDALGDAAAALTMPRWTDEPEQAFCGSCHGTPPADHADDRCSVCHGEVIAANGDLLAPERHIDGAFDVGTGCGDCHGSPSSPAPPPDLTGDTDTSLVTVGAHESHVSSVQLRGPIPCSACHDQPQMVDEPGHIDSAAPAEVFPGAAFEGLAAADGAAPVWDRARATCSDVYCHGGGTTLSQDAADSILREPVWTALGQDQAACGRCHGIPPDDGAHFSGLQLNQCRACHPSTVDEFGNIIVTGQPGEETSEHIDGDVDVQ